MSNTVSRVNDNTGERSLGHLGRSPRGCESKDGLDSNVPLMRQISLWALITSLNLHSQSLHIERLEHDLSGVLSVLRRIKRRFSLDKKCC